MQGISKKTEAITTPQYKQRSDINYYFEKNFLVSSETKNKKNGKLKFA